MTSSGLDLTHLDPTIRIQDDLFAHVNGGWLATHKIPADRATDGAFRALYDQAELHVQDIITDAPGQIGDLYASFLDTETVAKLGIEPIADELAAIRTTTNLTELATLLGSLQRTGVGGAVGLYVDTDGKNSQRYLANVTQSGIGLPDESYYREDAHAEVRAEYIAHIGRMFTLAGVEYDPQRVFELERTLAAGHWDVVKRRDAELGYNLTLFAQLPEGFDWSAWASGVKLAERPGNTALGSFPEVGVRQPSYLDSFVRAWVETPVEDWQAWLTWRVVHARAPYLTDELVAENFAFYGTTLSGATEIRERWKRAVALVQDLLGEAVGQRYVAKHFPPESKARMLELVENLREAYRRNITALDWMGADTKKAALAKLDKFTPKIGYPDSWRDYSSITIDPTDLVGNYRRGYAAEFDRDLGKLGKPVDRDEWFMTPQTVNAYYNPGMNEIVFPAAILQPPFFDPLADDAANYGGIGAVIGHEIGHGFDDQGAKYDGDGNMVDWWTDNDRAEFGTRTTALIEQYNTFEPQALPGHTVNGAFTVGENIGDLGGLSIALVAYEISLKGAKPPVIDGLTGLQRVFYGWSQVWRTKVRDEEALRRLAVDPHSPPEFRCNGVVPNIDAFYQAFDVKPGDALYLDPADRVQIW